MAPVGTATESTSPLTEYIINFEDRQELKVLEDLVVDLLVILPTLVKTLKDIKRQYDMSYFKKNMTKEEEMEMQAIKNELEEYLNEMETYSYRATALNASVKTTTQIVSKSEIWNSRPLILDSYLTFSTTKRQWP